MVAKNNFRKKKKKKRDLFLKTEIWNKHDNKYNITNVNCLVIKW